MKRWTWQKQRENEKTKKPQLWLKTPNLLQLAQLFYSPKRAFARNLLRFSCSKLFETKYFLQDFFYISWKKLPDRRFRAHCEAKNRRFPVRVFLIKLFLHNSKKAICRASAFFQGARKLSPLPRRLTLHHVCAALPLRFIQRPPSPRLKMLCLPRNYKMQQPKIALTRYNIMRLSR